MTTNANIKAIEATLTKRARRVVSGLDGVTVINVTVRPPTWGWACWEVTFRIATPYGLFIKKGYPDDPTLWDKVDITLYALKNEIQEYMKRET